MPEERWRGWFTGFGVQSKGSTGLKVLEDNVLFMLGFWMVHGGPISARNGTEIHEFGYSGVRWNVSLLEAWIVFGVR